MAFVIGIFGKNATAMAKRTTGKPYEELVEYIINKLKDNPEFEEVRRDVKVPGPDKDRQIDVLLTTTTPEGLKLQTIIECKDYPKTKIGIGRIGEFASLINDLNASKGIMVSSGGFTSGAVKKAKRLNISLYATRSTLHPDWNIHLEIPILFEIVDAPMFVFDFGEKGAKPAKEFRITDDNNRDVVAILLEMWANGKLPIQDIEDWQHIEWDSTKQYFIVNREGEASPVSIIGIKVKLKIKYYSSTLNKLQDVNVVKDINEKKTTVFIGGLDKLKLLEKCTQIKKDEIPAFNKHHFHFAIYLGWAEYEKFI